MAMKHKVWLYNTSKPESEMNFKICSEMDLSVQYLVCM